MAVAIKERRPVRGAEAIAERPDGTRITFVPYPTPLLDERGELVGAVNMLVDITDRKAAEEQQRLLMHEVNHRANNLLTIVQSIVRLTKSESVEKFRNALTGRLQALSRTHNLLAQSRWAEADLQHLVSEELSPFMGDWTQAWLAGTRLPLHPAAAQSIALIVHELATNAAKYGALSAGSGNVSVQWRVNDEQELVFRWQENGGPRPYAPMSRGVGSAVLERAAAQLGGVATFDWTDAGLRYELRAPAKQLVREDRR